MTKNDMLKATAEKLEGCKKADVEAVLSAFSEVILETLAANRDEKVTLPGVGTFSAKHVPERSGKVMMGESKGETWTKPAHDEVQFKVLKAVKTL